MPRHATRKQLRDRALIQAWSTRDDSAFAAQGLTREAVAAAQQKLRGHIVLPGDPGYDQDRRLSDARFDPHPLAIVYCAWEGDVQVALALARLTPYPFTVRSGGHCTAGFSAGPGLLIDVSGLDSLTVDTSALTATVGCGVNFGVLHATLAQHGLHVPAGECDDVCVGGFIQGGGYGFTSVSFGMSCDNVIDLRVMLADGSIVTASESVNRDLWWAMRGGTGGNFGVLLQVRFQLRALGPVWGFALIWPMQQPDDRARAAQALVALQDQILVPDDDPLLNVQVSFCFQPGIEPGLPLNGPLQPYLMIRGLYVGDPAHGAQAIAPLQALPGAVLQWTEQADLVQLNNDLLNRPYPMPCFAPNAPWPAEDKDSRYVAVPPTAAQWLPLLECFCASPNPFSYGYLECYGGAIRRYPRDGNAFIHRDVLYTVVLDVFWTAPADRDASVGLLNRWTALVDPLSNGEAYQNYPRLNQPDYGRAYWGDAQAGLYAVKTKYDPTHAFTFAQEVRAPDRPTAPLAPWLQQWLARPIQRP